MGLALAPTERISSPDGFGLASATSSRGCACDDAGAGRPLLLSSCALSLPSSADPNRSSRSRISSSRSAWLILSTLDRFSWSMSAMSVSSSPNALGCGFLGPVSSSVLLKPVSSMSPMPMALVPIPSSLRNPAPPSNTPCPLGGLISLGPAPSRPAPAGSLAARRLRISSRTLSPNRSLSSAASCSRSSWDMLSTRAIFSRCTCRRTCSASVSAGSSTASRSDGPASTSVSSGSGGSSRTGREENAEEEEEGPTAGTESTIRPSPWTRRPPARVLSSFRARAKALVPLLRCVATGKPRSCGTGGRGADAEGSVGVGVSRSTMSLTNMVVVVDS